MKKVTELCQLVCFKKKMSFDAGCNLKFPPLMSCFPASKLAPGSPRRRRQAAAWRGETGCQICHFHELSYEVKFFLFFDFYCIIFGLRKVCEVGGMF